MCSSTRDFKSIKIKTMKDVQPATAKHPFRSPTLLLPNVWWKHDLPVKQLGCGGTEFFARTRPQGAEQQPSYQ